MDVKITPAPPRTTLETDAAPRPSATASPDPRPAGDVGPSPEPGEAPTANAPTASAPTTKQAAWDPGDDYEKHLPRETRLSRFIDEKLERVAPIRTHERVISEAGASIFGLDVGITFSQLELVKKGTRGVELVQVVNRDGSSNVETILARRFVGEKHRFELQGPALNSSVTPGEAPLGARFLGVGFTSDATSAMDHDAVSYTVEVKLTERSVVELAALGGPGAAVVAADLLGGVAGSGTAAVVSDVILGAVPVLSAALAFASARRAVHVVRDRTASKEMKTFAVLHAVSDAVRIVFPLAGTLGNAALVGAAALLGWMHVRYAEHAPPTGPPGANASRSERPTTDAAPTDAPVARSASGGAPDDGPDRP